MWSSQVSSVVDAGFRAITIDLPGFGRSGGSIRSIPETARLVLSVCDHLGIKRFGLCGLSMGGYVSFEIIRAVPERIRFAVLCDTTPEADSEEKRSERFESSAEILNDGPHRFLEGMKNGFLSDKTSSDPKLQNEFDELFSEADSKSMAAALEAMAVRSSSKGDVEHFGFPVVAIYGAEDPMIGAGRSMAASAPSGSFIEIEGAGHFSNLEQPESFNKALIAFLKEHAVE